MFKRNSFSLVEIIVATCIFLILANMAFLTLNTGMNAWFSGGTSVELRNEIIRGLTAMAKELKQTAPGEVDYPPSPGSATYIIFSLPQDLDNDGTIIDWSGFAANDYEPTIEYAPTTVRYELNSTGQIIRISSGQSRIIAKDIVSLQFTRPATESDILQINIGAQKKDKKGRVISDTASLIIKMRNN